MKYNKVRRILRAKQGSQIPKFNAGGGFLLWLLSLNTLSLGSNNATPLVDATDFQLPIKTVTDSNGQPRIPLVKEPSGFSWNTDLTKTAELKYKELLYKKTFTDTLGDKAKFDYFNNSLNSSQNEKSSDKLTGWLKFGKKMGQVGTGLAEGVGNFITDNSDMIMGGAKILSQGSLDIVGDNFGKFSNTMSTIKGVADNFGPMGKAVGAVAGTIDVWGNVINALGAKKLLNFSIDRGVQERVGGAYAGSYTDITKAGDLAGKKVGLFGNARGKNRFIDEQRRVQSKIASIDATNLDMLTMAGNDLNYLNYQMQSNGGYNQLYMAIRAKLGTKILDKIDLVKSRKFNQVINVNTKEIELEPITDCVEGFKGGGSLPELWEPIIDDAIDYWEPVIDDIELYREGGKTKEELETPEIEETSLKNLIPEGALHKNKHHMEHTEGLTLKGIPVIDNEGEQLAEIELDEIIFTLEVTKKLEELYKDGSDEAAIEAGKLLVKEILFNTDDRTGLIAKCEKGGKL